MKYLVALLIATFAFLITLPTVPTAATSDNVVIYQVQTGSPASASQEIILLLNTSATPVNISDWCLFYSSASNATIRALACIDTPLQTEIWVEANGFMSFASGEFVIASPGFVPDASFASGLAAGGGHIWIENANSTIIDKVGWGTATVAETSAAAAHTSGKVLSRNTLVVVDTDNNLNDFSSQTLQSPITSGLYEVQVLVDLCPNIDDLQIELRLGYLQDESGDCFLDICPNLDELQKEIPLGYEMNAIDCVEIPKEDSILLITELLPNASSSDTGKEFVEIYNPNSHTVNLSGYRLQLGPGFTKQFVVTGGTIAPGQYIVFSDNESDIVLPNTNGIQLRLVAPSGDIVSETPIYSNAPDDTTWELLDDQWIYTNRPTPGEANLPYLAAAEDEEVNVTVVLAPCPAGKYRNPETNRCRNIETAVSSLTACDEDESRNPDTNRCRKVTGATVLAACAVGQERNPETNRCRKVSTLASSDTALAIVEDVEVESTPGQINWLVIAIALAGTLTYMAYEWRSELTHFYLLQRAKFIR